MRHIFAIALVAVLTGILSPDILAQTNAARTDSIAATLRLNSLQTKKEKLEKEIKEQDGKRNSRIAGVAPETMEKMNDRQDSICLALRSELLDVILEIKEITPAAVSPQFIQQYNNLINREDGNPAENEENHQSSSAPTNAKEPEK